MIEFEFEMIYFDQVEVDIAKIKYWYCSQNPDFDLEEQFFLMVGVLTNHNLMTYHFDC